MFAAFVNWYKKRQDDKRKTRFNRGFATAMSVIMDKEETLDSLQDKIDMSRHMGEYDDFDRGVEAFIRQARQIEDMTKVPA